MHQLDMRNIDIEAAKADRMDLTRLLEQPEPVIARHEETIMRAIKLLDFIIYRSTPQP